MAKQLVVVLGMHRSGTSAITRGLKVLGVDLGESFIPNYDDNVKGFWEDADFQAINVKMLHALGHDWHTLSIFTDESLSEKLSGFRLEALDLLKQKLRSAGVFGIKDPRLSRLLPFWRGVFSAAGVEVRYVLPLRNPISVALSLQKRNGFDFEKSFFLWQQHMLLSMLEVQSEPLVVVDFDFMLAEPELQLSRISQALGLAQPSAEALEEYSGDYLDKELRHAEYTLEDLQSEPALPGDVLELFQLLSMLASDKKTINDKGVGELLIRQWQLLEQSTPLFRLFDRSDGSLRVTQKQCEDLKAKVELHVADIKKQSQALSQLREAIDQQKLANEALKEQLAEQRDNYRRAISEHRQAIDSHQKRFSEQKEQYQKHLSEQKEQYQKHLSEQKEQYQKHLSEQKELYRNTVAEHSRYEARQEAKNSDQQRLLALRQREIDRLSVGNKQKQAKLGQQEKQLVALSEQLRRVEGQYSRLTSTPEYRIGSELRSLIRSGGKLLGTSTRLVSGRPPGVSDAVLKLVKRSGVFDETWYMQGFSADQQPEHPLHHYLSAGWKEGYEPSVLFDGKWYLSFYPDVKAAGICPLRHYLEQGWKEGRQPHPAFDGAWYLRFYDDVQVANISPLQHYIRYGAREGRRPNKFFDVEWFVKKYSGKIESPETNGALVSYLLANQQGNLTVEHCPLFCSGDYAIKNPEFELCKESALEHFSSRAKRYILEVVLRSEFDEGIKKSFDQALAAEFCLKVRRAEFNGVNEVRSPLVSIVMPTHNRQSKICSAIDSVLQQSYANWELLIIDDGSEDDTCQLVRESYSDSRISIKRIEASGVCRARNAALERAKGELIAYLDSDNAWVIDFLEVMVAYLQQEAADFAYAAIRMQNESGTSYRYREFSGTDLLIKNFVDLNAILHKRELYDQQGGFNEALSRMVDWDLIIRYTKSAKVVSAPFVGVNYDNHKQPDRITVKEPKSWRYAIMNQHLIDWDKLVSEVGSREKELVSVIIPVYGQVDLTRKCVLSLLQVPSGRPFEVILVDNGSDYDVLEELFMWSEGNANISLVRNPENLNFALGCNIGFAHARGARVVFLNNDTEVTSGWLDKLISSLQGDVGAVQPKLVYPDGRIQCAGIVFSERSSIGFPIYADFPAELPAVNCSRKYQAITAACMAVNSADFARLRGFDPLYVNGQEDVDFCLRLAELGKACWYEADSMVIHHESRTPGRGQFIAQNRLLFDQRWSDRLVPDAEQYFQADGYRVRGWRTDGQKVAGYQPVLSKPILSGAVRESLAFAIKVPCPDAGLKDEWGDYHFACSLGAALRRAGHSFRIDFLNEWSNGTGSNEVNLVLRGLSVFEPRPEQTNLMWMISHPDKVAVDELEKYDHVFVASQAYTEELQQQLGDRVSCLLQCTDPALFYPDEKNADYSSEVLFVGNSRNQYREVVRLAVELDCDLAVYGTRWQQFIGTEYIRGENIPNHRLGHYYRNAAVVLNDHWPDMREKGFVSNRVFDVLACGAPVVSDEIPGVPADLRDYILTYVDRASLNAAITQARQESLLLKQKRFRLALHVHQQHSFDARVKQLLGYLTNRSGNAKS